MIYEYHCKKCDTLFDVAKSVSERDSEERCTCGEVAGRIPFPRMTYLNQTRVENAEYNPGLGCVTKNSKHRKEIAKRQGLVEIGNDYASGESQQKAMKKYREEKREQSWAEVDKEIREVL